MLLHLVFTCNFSIHSEFTRRGPCFVHLLPKKLIPWDVCQIMPTFPVLIPVCPFEWNCDISHLCQVFEQTSQLIVGP